MVFGSSKKQNKKIKEQDYPTYQPPQPSRQQSVNTEPSLSASFLGKTMNIEGEIFSDEDLTIEGKVKGSIEVTRTLTIGKSGDVEADIHAKVVKIIGKARGNIVATDKVAILSDGMYEGNIKSEKLVVAEGAILIGLVNEDPDEAKKTGPKTKTKPPKEEKKEEKVEEKEEEKEEDRTEEKEEIVDAEIIEEKEEEKAEEAEEKKEEEKPAK